MNESSMKDRIPNWLDNPRLSHVQACWLRLANGDTSIQFAGTDQGNEFVEHSMRCIASIVPLLTDQQLVPGWIIWNFASGRLYYVVRADGAVLGLYCKTGSDQESAAVADLLADFAQRM